RHHQCHSHPHDPGLGLEANLVGLHVCEIALSNDLLVMETLAMLSRRLHPFANRLGLEAKGGHDGWHGATVADEREHTGDGCFRGATTKEGCASAVAKRLMAEGAAIAHTLATMDTDVALADLPPCRAVHIGTKYGLRIDDTPPSALKH